MKKSEFDFIQSFSDLASSKRLYVALNDRYLTIERGIELMTEGYFKDDSRKQFERLKRGLAMIGNALSILEDRFEDSLCDAVEWESDDNEGELIKESNVQKMHVANSDKPVLEDRFEDQLVEVVEWENK